MMNPIFICGTGRSGTTILQQILSKHKNIYSMRFESRFIVSEGGLFSLINSTDKNAVANFKGKVLNDWYISKIYNVGQENEYKAGLCVNIDKITLNKLLDKFEHDFHIEGDLEHKYDIIRVFLKEFYEHQMINTSAKRWLEKTPANLLFMHEFRTLLPQCKLIHIIRDGRDVASSILKQDFWPIWKSDKIEFLKTNHKRTVRSCSIYWRDLLEFGIDIGKSIGSDWYIEIKFEDLIRNTEEELRKICIFLNEDFDQNMLNIDLSRANLGSWKDVFKPSDIIDFKAEAGSLLVDLGYEVSNDW